MREWWSVMSGCWRRPLKFGGHIVSAASGVRSWEAFGFCLWWGPLGGGRLRVFVDLGVSSVVVLSSQWGYQKFQFGALLLRVYYLLCWCLTLDFVQYEFEELEVSGEWPEVWFPLGRVTKPQPLRTLRSACCSRQEPTTQLRKNKYIYL